MASRIVSYRTRTVVAAGYVTSSMCCGIEKIIASLNVGLLSSRFDDVFFLATRQPSRDWYTLNETSATSFTRTKHIHRAGHRRENLQPACTAYQKLLHLLHSQFFISHPSSASEHRLLCEITEGSEGSAPRATVNNPFCSCNFRLSRGMT